MEMLLGLLHVNSFYNFMMIMVRVVFTEFSNLQLTRKTRLSIINKNLHLSDLFTELIQQQSVWSKLQSVCFVNLKNLCGFTVRFTFTYRCKIGSRRHIITVN